MKIYIRNMVCNRCKMVVEAEFRKFGLHPIAVELGEVEVSEGISEQQKVELNQQLSHLGFEIIDDRKSRIIEKIKTEIVSQVHYSESQLKINFSKHISQLLNHDYSYLSNLFSSVEGTTIEQYFIAQKIERVKELIVYDELSIGEIAFKLNYSSIPHLSRQFKKVTGLTPTHFKNLKANKRIPIEEVKK